MSERGPLFLGPGKTRSVVFFIPIDLNIFIRRGDTGTVCALPVFSLNTIPPSTESAEGTLIDQKSLPKCSSQCQRMWKTSTGLIPVSYNVSAIGLTRSAISLHIGYSTEIRFTTGTLQLKLRGVDCAKRCLKPRYLSPARFPMKLIFTTAVTTYKCILHFVFCK